MGILRRAAPVLMLPLLAVAMAGCMRRPGPVAAYPYPSPYGAYAQAQSPQAHAQQPYAQQQYAQQQYAPQQYAQPQPYAAQSYSAQPVAVPAPATAGQPGALNALRTMLATRPRGAAQPAPMMMQQPVPMQQPVMQQPVMQAPVAAAHVPRAAAGQHAAVQSQYPQSAMAAAEPVSAEALNAQAQMAMPASAMPMAYRPAYALDSGDKLRVIVFGQEGLTNSYTVDAGGQITMPLIGAVPARGMTPSDLAHAIATRLRNGFVRDPQVAAEIETYRPFFILGEVTAPGQYAYVPNMTVSSAVAIAGGFSARAQKQSVQLARQTPGGIAEAAVPLAAPLMPGDTIIVRERWF